MRRGGDQFSPIALSHKGQPLKFGVKKLFGITLVPKNTNIFGINIFCDVELLESLLFLRYVTSYFVKKIIFKKKSVRKTFVIAISQ